MPVYSFYFCEKNIRSRKRLVISQYQTMLVFCLMKQTELKCATKQVTSSGTGQYFSCKAKLLGKHHGIPISGVKQCLAILI